MQKKKLLSVIPTGRDPKGMAGLQLPPSLATWVGPTGRAYTRRQN